MRYNNFRILYINITYSNLSKLIKYGLKYEHHCTLACIEINLKCKVNFKKSKRVTIKIK